MPTLKEFLAAEAEKLRGEQADAMNKRAEWIASVERLLAQMKGWLEQADAERILAIVEAPVRVSEQGLGTYEAPALTVGLGAREVRIKPIARYVSAPLRATALLQMPRAYGRVDMTNGLDCYHIFRVEKDAADRWKIVEQNGPMADSFNRTSFESALKSLLE